MIIKDEDEETIYLAKIKTNIKREGNVMKKSLTRVHAATISTVNSSCCGRLLRQRHSVGDGSSTCGSAEATLSCTSFCIEVSTEEHHSSFQSWVSLRRSSTTWIWEIRVQRLLVTRAPERRCCSFNSVFCSSWPSSKLNNKN